MLKYKLELDIQTLQDMHTALENAFEEAEENGEDKQAFRYYQARKELEAQLERQGIEFQKE